MLPVGGVMSEILFHYKRPDPTTWVYLSSFLTIGLFFVFHRFWSIRNLDILMLILLAPGLLMVHQGRRDEFHASELVAAADAMTLAEQPAAGEAEPAAGEDASADRPMAADELPADDLSAGATGLATAESPTTAIDADPSPAEDPSPAADSASELTPRPNKLRDNAEAVLSLRDRLGLIGDVESARSLQLRGFIWLLAIQVLILLRLLLDSAMVRRPLLDPNLTTGGLFFIGISLLVFLMANVITSTARQNREQGPELSRAGYPLMQALPTLPTRPDAFERLDAPITEAVMEAPEPSPTARPTPSTTRRVRGSIRSGPPSHAAAASRPSR